MDPFIEQLGATRANLDRLAALAAKCPELFDGGRVIQVEPTGAQVYLHASRHPDRNWKVFLRQWPEGKWTREESVVAAAWDYRGKLDGVNICIIGAEKRPAPEPLVVEEGAIA